MSNILPPQTKSVFRTEAWTQAWLDTWGAQISKGLIDLGGRGRPLEMLYRIPHRFKKIIPATVLSLVGNGFGSLSTPRSEYNNVSDLIQVAGGAKALGKELQKLPWQQLWLPDIASGHREDEELQPLLRTKPWGAYLIKEEAGYSIENISLNEYLAKLSSSTRLAFFNRRARLEKCGNIERRRYHLSEVEAFFSLLNNFHLHRWGKQCYSSQSMAFVRNFCQRLSSCGGEPVFESILVNGEPVSVLFDVIWCNRRYNLQSGYAENFAHKVPLGSLHLGYAIEDALKAGLKYDFLAGQGKRTDYKASVGTHRISQRSYIATRGYWKLIKGVQENTRRANMAQIRAPL